MGVYQSFVETVDRYKGRPAVIYLGETLNYIDLLRTVELLFYRIIVAGS